MLRLLEQHGPLGSAEIREGLGLKDRTHVREHYLNPALENGLIELTLPDKPRSRLQKYKLSARGQAVLAATRKA